MAPLPSFPAFRPREDIQLDRPSFSLFICFSCCVLSPCFILFSPFLSFFYVPFVMHSLSLSLLFIYSLLFSFLFLFTFLSFLPYLLFLSQYPGQGVGHPVVPLFIFSLLLVLFSLSLSLSYIFLFVIYRFLHHQLVLALSLLYHLFVSTVPSFHFIIILISYVFSFSFPLVRLGKVTHLPFSLSPSLLFPFSLFTPVFNTFSFSHSLFLTPLSLLFSFSSFLLPLIPFFPSLLSLIYSLLSFLLRFLFHSVTHCFSLFYSSFAPMLSLVPSSLSLSSCYPFVYSFSLLLLPSLFLSYFLFFSSVERRRGSVLSV